MRDQTQYSKPDPFAEHAARIFEAAQAADGSHTNLTIIINSAGALRLIEGSEQPLEILQAEYGVRMIYRVHRDGRNVRLEGRNGTRRCFFEAPEDRRAPQVSAGTACYLTAAASPDDLNATQTIPSKIWQLPPEELD